MRIEKNTLDFYSACLQVSGIWSDHKKMYNVLFDILKEKAEVNRLMKGYDSDIVLAMINGDKVSFNKAVEKMRDVEDISIEKIKYIVKTWARLVICSSIHLALVLVINGEWPITNLDKDFIARYRENMIDETTVKEAMKELQFADEEIDLCINLNDDGINKMMQDFNYRAERGVNIEVSQYAELLIAKFVPLTFVFYAFLVKIINFPEECYNEIRIAFEQAICIYLSIVSSLEYEKFLMDITACLHHYFLATGYYLCIDLNEIIK